MQVLVVLLRAHGNVVSRDDLVASCWEGRIVGDDAINRVLSRLRRLEDDVARGVFTIETITRIGYRLVPAKEVLDETGNAIAAPQPAASSAIAVAPPQPDRRHVIAAGGIAFAAAGVGGAWWLTHRERLSPAAQEALERGRQAMSQTLPDQTASAIAAFREATELAPDTATPWGELALAYQMQLRVSGPRTTIEGAQIESRLRAAAARALAIEPGNADAEAALAGMPTTYRRWIETDRAFAPVLAAHPRHPPANRLYGIFQTQVNRLREALGHFRIAIEGESNWPQVHMRLASTLWFLGQLDDADAAMGEAFKAWPRHFSVWFMRTRFLTYTGRADAALAMLADQASRPIGIPDWNFAMAEAEIRAVRSGARSDIDTASRLMTDAAHKAAGLASNAIVFHAYVGRIDDAFRLIDAYYFDRGFTVGPQRYSTEQGMFDLRRDRDTYFLFIADCAALHGDPRFAKLIREFGLEDYWRRSNITPDFRRRPA